MAHLWFHLPDDEWSAMSLVDGNYILGGDGGPIASTDAPIASLGNVRLLRCLTESFEQWLIVAKAFDPAITLNGCPLATGLEVLADKDEIRVAGKRPYYFSTETLPAIEPFPDHRAEPTQCARCRQVIPVAADSVCCPKCDLYYHSTLESPCWSYSPFCICGRTTDLEAGYEWSPLGL